MLVRFSIKACSAAGALAASLAFAPAAFAQDSELPGASYTMPAVLAQAAPQLPPASAGLPDPRPEWPGGPAASPAPISHASMSAAAAPQLDPQARDAWLRECRHRTDFYYDDGHRRRKSVGGYDYCEAYLDDYYRYYAQAGYSGYAHPGHGHMMMAPRMTMAPTRVASPAAAQPCEEVVTEEWVPERTRIIPRRPAQAPVRRPVPDKRIRVY